MAEVKTINVGGMAFDIKDEPVREQIGSEEELANLPNPAESIAANITQINSNLNAEARYKSGDTFNSTQSSPVTGLCASANSVYLYIPVPKYIPESLTPQINVTNVTSLSTITGGKSITGADVSAIRISHGYGVRVLISGMTGLTANTPAALFMAYSITFN